MERFDYDGLLEVNSDLRNQLADAQAAVEALQRERDEAWIRFACVGSHAEFLSDLDDLLTNHCLAMNALDAEREKVKDGETAYKKLSEQWNAVDLKLSQLQALVRALEVPKRYVVSADDHGGQIRLPDGYILFTATSRSRTYALENLFDYVRATLDATTPAAKGGDDE